MGELPGDVGVRSVQLALDVLETVAFSAEELGVTQIAERLGATKGSVHRHLMTLVDRGYLQQNALSTRYSVGPKSRVLARIAPDSDLVQVAEAPMRDLRDRLGQTVVLSSPTPPRGALVAFTVPSASPIEIGVRPGSELPFQSTAQGRILLAYSPRPFQERILSRDLKKLTDKTVVDRSALEAELANVLRQGYATAPEEALLGVNAVAGPVFDGNDAVVAAVAVVGSIQFLPPCPDATIVSALKACCEQISRKIGFRQHTDRLRPTPGAGVTITPRSAKISSTSRRLKA